ncbi:ABC transporter permease [Streptomyces sp. NPDC086091]|uniref:ABC transporter permease n=1 Tax=Streptomyces sp. NPDC086091 TaxID=3365751 RepID=UPI00381AF6F2
MSTAAAPSASSASAASGEGRPARPAGLRPLLPLLLVPLLAALALWAFAWPAARTAPNDLPLGVAGPAAQADQVAERLGARDGAFEIHRYADEAAARDAVADRTVYGAVVVTPQGPELLTASAGGPVVAQFLQQAVGAQAAAEGTALRTVDVVPAPAADPRGAALGASVLPLALAGIAAGALVTLLGLRGVRAALTLLGAAALVGVVGVALAHSWLEVLTGNWWAEAGVLGLSTLAVGAAVAGCAALLGPAGIGVVGFVVMFLGNPFSGAASAPRMLPDPVGAIGQWLPPGAGTTLLRSVSFFDGASATGPLLTLTWWAALGLGAVLLGPALRNRARTPQPTTPGREPALAG